MYVYIYIYMYRGVVVAARRTCLSQGVQTQTSGSFCSIRTKQFRCPLSSGVFPEVVVLTDRPPEFLAPRSPWYRYTRLYTIYDILHTILYYSERLGLRVRAAAACPPAGSHSIRYPSVSAGVRHMLIDEYACASDETVWTTVFNMLEVNKKGGP